MSGSVTKETLTGPYIWLSLTKAVVRNATKTCRGICTKTSRRICTALTRLTRILSTVNPSHPLLSKLWTIPKKTQQKIAPQLKFLQIYKNKAYSGGHSLHSPTMVWLREDCISVRVLRRKNENPLNLSPLLIQVMLPFKVDTLNCKQSLKKQQCSGNNRVDPELIRQGDECRRQWKADLLPQVVHRLRIVGPWAGASRS